MRVRFNSTKERHPDRENGLRVLYGPSKRAGYRLRWYLILALVGSPLAWLVIKPLHSLLVLDAPAQLSLNSQEVRAADNGRVEELSVRVGNQVRSGQVLLRLSNPDWQLRARQLQQPIEPATTGAVETTALAAKSLQAQAVAIQKRTVDLYRSLQRRGGLASAEVLQAENQLAQQRLAQQELERRMTQDRWSQQGTPLEARRTEQERQWLNQRLQRLIHTANGPARVSEILVGQGESVSPGSVLMRLERPDPPVIWIYLRPGDNRAAWPGRRVQVAMPDGSWKAATILGQADLARRLPAGLTRGGENQLNLRVPARFTEPLPNRWRIDQLPLSVRFPGLLERLFG
jgi:hypothetical protein